MNRARISGFLAAAGLLVSSSAFAINWTTNHRTILELRQSGGKDTYEVSFVTPLTGTNDNPLTCSDNTTAEMDPGLTATQKDLLNRTLLAAFMAGKTIRLHIKETGSCINNRPVFVGVRYTKDS